MQFLNNAHEPSTMRLLSTHSHVVRHAAATLVLGMACLGHALAARASQPEAPAPIISKTTLAEARAMWSASEATIVSEGHLAIGGGNGVDGLSTVGLEQVLLVTVSGVDFEKLPVARYAFVDEVLYAVSAQLRKGYSNVEPPYKVLSDEELSQLKETLMRRHGKPRALKDMGAGKRPNIFIWDLREDELVMTEGGLSGYTLARRNKALAKKVDAYKKTECKKHRQRGSEPTPVTSICL